MSTMLFSLNRFFEKSSQLLILFSVFISLCINLSIVFVLLLGAIDFFCDYPIKDFLFSTEWSPNDLVNPSFGILPLFTGSIIIVFIAVLISVFFGLMVAIYLSEYLCGTLSDLLTLVFRVLSGLPTIVYGCFAIKIIAPNFHHVFSELGLNISYESGFIAGVSVGIMILPFLINMFYDTLQGVPNSLRESSYALGATKFETILFAILPSCKDGIYSSVLFAISRAIGETIIVVMSVGVMAKMTLNPFDSMTTLTVQLVRLLIGDQELDNIGTSAAYAIGVFLFVMTLFINLYARKLLSSNKKSKNLKNNIT